MNRFLVGCLSLALPLAGVKAIKDQAGVTLNDVVLAIVAGAVHRYLADRDGLEVLKHVREWTNTPGIMLSVRDADRDKAAALDAGADDYLTKPFSTVELFARLRVAARHAQPAPADTIYTFGDLQVDLVRRVVMLRGEPVKLTPTEYALLRLMVQHAGRVLTHRQILRQVWGPDYVEETHYLRVYFAQLRQKLGEDPTHPKLIVTEPGVGYRLMMD